MISSMRHILHAPCTRVNASFVPAVHIPGVTDVWTRIEAELETRKDARGRPVAWMSKKLDVSIQTVNNWKTRGVPADRHQAIAAALGWSVDRLLGRAPTQATIDWPFELISRQQWDALSERQRGAVEAAAIKALRELPDTQPAITNTKNIVDKRH